MGNNNVTFPLTADKLAGKYSEKDDFLNLLRTMAAGNDRVTIDSNNYQKEGEISNLTAQNFINFVEKQLDGLYTELQPFRGTENTWRGDKSDQTTTSQLLNNNFHAPVKDGNLSKQEIIDFLKFNALMHQARPGHDKYCASPETDDDKKECDAVAKTHDYWIKRDKAALSQLGATIAE